MLCTKRLVNVLTISRSWEINRCWDRVPEVAMNSSTFKLCPSRASRRGLGYGNRVNCLSFLGLFLCLTGWHSQGDEEILVPAIEEVVRETVL